MRIAICSSMSFVDDMVKIKDYLVYRGHEVVLPRNTELYANGSLIFESRVESAENKLDHDLIKNYFKEIQNSNAALIVNKTKNNIENYVGGNTLMEMGFAYVLDKKIFLLNPIPAMSYTAEIEAMSPVVINGYLNLIK